MFAEKPSTNRLDQFLMEHGFYAAYCSSCGTTLVKGEPDCGACGRKVARIDRFFVGSVWIAMAFVNGIGFLVLGSGFVMASTAPPTLYLMLLLSMALTCASGIGVYKRKQFGLWLLNASLLSWIAWAIVESLFSVRSMRVDIANARGYISDAVWFWYKFGTPAIVLPVSLCFYIYFKDREEWFIASPRSSKPKTGSTKPSEDE